MPIVIQNDQAIAFEFTPDHVSDEVKSSPEASHHGEKKSATKLSSHAEAQIENVTGTQVSSLSSTTLIFNYALFGGKSQFDSLSTIDSAKSQSRQDLIQYVRGVLGAYVKQMSLDLQTHENSWVSNGMDYAVSHAKLSLVHKLLCFIGQQESLFLDKDGLDQLLVEVNKLIDQLPRVYDNQSAANALMSNVSHYASIAKNMFSFRGTDATPTRLKALLIHLCTVIDYHSQCVKIKVKTQKIMFKETITFNPRLNNQGLVRMMLLMIKEINLPSKASLSALLIKVQKDASLAQSVKAGFCKYVSKYNSLCVELSGSKVSSYDQLQQLYLLSSSLKSFMGQYNAKPARRSRKKSAKKKAARPTAKVSSRFFKQLPQELANSYRDENKAQLYQAETAVEFKQ